MIIGALSIWFNKPFTIPEFKTITLRSADLDKYVGNYSSNQNPLKISVTKNDLNLYAQATGQNAFPLEAVDKDKFVCNSIGVTLLFDPAKNSFTITQGGTSFVYTKTN